MVWDWSVRLVLPLLALLLAALVCRLIAVSRRSTLQKGASRKNADVERTVLAVLAVIVLGVTGWWIASWLLFSSDVLQQAAHRP